MKDWVFVSPKEKLWLVSESEIPLWLDNFNTRNLVLLVVGNTFFNSVTGWHDIRVYRFARAFEALGFTPLVMCRWTTAATEVAGTYEGIAFYRLAKPAHWPVSSPRPGVAAMQSGSSSGSVAAVQNVGRHGNSDAVGYAHSQPEPVTRSAGQPRLGVEPLGITRAALATARDIAKFLGVLEFVRPAWRVFYRVTRASVRLPFRVYKLLRVARNQAVKSAKRFAVPWIRHLNLRFSEDFIQATQPLHPSFIYAADLNTLWAASRVARTRSVPLIYDSHEYFLSYAQHAWMTPTRRFIDKLVCRCLEARLIPRVVQLISVSDGLVSEFTRRFPNVKCLCVRNASSLMDAAPRNDRIRDETNISADTRIALYIGLITRGRGIIPLLQAASYLPDDIVIAFLGGGSYLDQCRSKASDLGVDDRVYFLGQVPEHEVLSYAAAADCGLSLIQPTCFSYYHSLPNKFFQYAVSGTPILCSDFPDMASLVKRHGMGDVCDPTNPREISDTIVKLLSVPSRWKEMSENCLQAARAELNWETEARKLSFCRQFARSHR